jgi:DNA-binding response OmpR family regulator
VIARVLLVDDDELIRRAISLSLRRAGFDVVTVDDGVPAIGLGKTTAFDLVVVDLHMKKSTGIDVVRYFKGRFGCQIYCAVLTGDDDEATRAACAAAGADDVIAKPTSAAELRTRLTAAARALRGDAAAS